MDTDTTGEVPAEVELGDDIQTDHEQIAQDQKKRAEKAEQEIKQLKDQLGTLDKLKSVFTPEENVEDKAPDLSQFVSKSEYQETLSLKDAGYSTAEVEYMRNHARINGKSASEVREDPFIKAAIKTMRDAVEVDQSTPPPSDRPVPQAASETARGGDPELDSEGRVVKKKMPSYAEWQSSKNRRGSNE